MGVVHRGSLRRIGMMTSGRNVVCYCDSSRFGSLIYFRDVACE